MQQVLLVIHVLVALVLIGVVLLQRSEGGGLGMGGGGMGGLMTVRGTANMLTRATAVLAAAFMVTSLLLAIMASQSIEPGAIVTPIVPESAPAPPPVPLAD